MRRKVSEVRVNKATSEQRRSKNSGWTVLSACIIRSLASTFPEKVKMANISQESFTKLVDSVTAMGGNLDQLFLLVMGCLIFCKYIFFSY